MTGETDGDAATLIPDRQRPTFEREVEAMFEAIASGYEWFDHLASAGNDLLWRPRSVWAWERFRSPGPVERILDLGCGTGEFLRLLARRYRSAQVVGADLTSGMLRVARRWVSPGRAPAFVRANAQRLPFRSGQFDLVVNGFLLRNLSDLAAAFGEMARVLRPGGTLVSLEISEPPQRLVRSLFHAYFDHVVPWMGAAVGRAGPYRYLPLSLRSLPSRTVILDLLARAGFSRRTAQRQSMGIVTTFLAERAPTTGGDAGPRSPDASALSGPSR